MNQQDDEEATSDFSMDQSFSEVHATAGREEQIISDRHLLLKQLNVKPILLQPEYYCNEATEWNIAWKQALLHAEWIVS